MTSALCFYRYILTKCLYIADISNSFILSLPFFSFMDTIVEIKQQKKQACKSFVSHTIAEEP